MSIESRSAEECLMALGEYKAVQSELETAEYDALSLDDQPVILAKEIM